MMDRLAGEILLTNLPSSTPLLGVHGIASDLYGLEDEAARKFVLDSARWLVEHGYIELGTFEREKEASPQFIAWSGSTGEVIQKLVQVYDLSQDEFSWGMNVWFLNTEEGDRAAEGYEEKKKRRRPVRPENSLP